MTDEWQKKKLRLPSNRSLRLEILARPKSVLEAGKASAFPVAFWACVVVESERLAIHLLAEGDLRKGCGVVGSAKCGSLVAKTSFWVWHLLLLPVQGVLLEVGVELSQLKSIRRVPLVLSGGVIAFAILGTYEADDFADFAFLGHDSNLLA